MVNLSPDRALKNIFFENIASGLHIMSYPMICGFDSGAALAIPITTMTAIVAMIIFQFIIFLIILS
jgi:hypothetical protein